MSSTLQKLTEQALRLPVDERAQLIEAILASVGTGLDDAWRDEVAQRLVDWESGLMEPVDGGEVFAQARRITA